VGDGTVAYTLSVRPRIVAPFFVAAAALLAVSLARDARA
jgi:hypothetical protein